VKFRENTTQSNQKNTGGISNQNASMDLPMHAREQKSKTIDCFKAMYSETGPKIAAKAPTIQL
jgi:hypothetical protein